MVAILIVIALFASVFGFIFGFEFGWNKAHKEFQRDMKDLTDFYTDNTRHLVNKIIERREQKKEGGAE